MKKIKKILLLLLAFSFTTLLFNSQAYAVEYYEFTFMVSDATNQDDVQFTPVDFFDNLGDFVIKYGTYNILDDSYILNGLSFISDIDGNIWYDTSNGYLVYSGSGTYDFEYYFNGQELKSAGIIFIEQEYTIITSVLITFTKTFWDQIIDVVGDIAVAFQAAASAGISLIYDGTALTSLGEIITITLGVGLVIGLFYLVIRVLPGARL